MSSAPETEAPPGGDEARPEVDEARQKLLTDLGDLALASEVAGGDITVRVDKERWHDAVRACRDDLGMDYFCFLSGLDWLDNPVMSGEKAWGSLPEAEADADADADGEGDAEAEAEAEGEPGDGDAATTATGVAGGESRFQVFARLYSLTSKLGITLKADLDETAPSVRSVTDLYRGADWHERETWEMYGFDFPGHPALRHLYLPGEFEGHPLRKDFPLLAREVKPWPGLVDVEPMPGGGDEEEAAAE